MPKILRMVYFSLVLVHYVLNEERHLLEVPKREWITKTEKTPKITRYIDVYTNHEDVQEVIENYYNALRSTTTSKPLANQHQELDSSVEVVQERKDLYQHSNYAYSNKGDILQSDFGEFTNDDDTVAETSGTFSNKKEIFSNTMDDFRPVLTPQNYNRTHESITRHSYIQKIPKGKNKHKTTNDTKERIHTLLRQYLRKLYLQKYSTVRNERKQHIDNVGEASEGKIFWNELSSLKNKTIKFANKFFSLFHVVQFPNSRCTVTSGSSMYIGTCYPSEDCDKRGGTPMGNCADGYGVCCVFRYSCGQSSSQNCSYFESPGYPDYTPPDSSTIPPTLPPPTPNPSPTPDPRKHYYYYGNQWSRQGQDGALSCTFSVFKASDNIQQMRIDFEDLELMGPTDGTCVNERLVISGQNVNDQVPVICGYSTGQHVYVDVSMLSGPLQLSVLANMATRKRYKLRICQLATACSNSMNCLQWYTGITGVISSFNYDQAAMYNRSTPGYFLSTGCVLNKELVHSASCIGKKIQGVQRSTSSGGFSRMPKLPAGYFDDENNLNYAICIRKEAGYCSVTYTNVQNDREYPFELINLEESGATTVPVGQAGVGIFECPDDYIVIDGIRVCGYRFNDGTVIDDLMMNAPIRDTSAGPIIIPVRTNQDVTGRGFKLFYTQNVCPTQLNNYIL